MSNLPWPYILKEALHRLFPQLTLKFCIRIVDRHIKWCDYVISFYKLGIFAHFEKHYYKVFNINVIFCFITNSLCTAQVGLFFFLVTKCAEYFFYMNRYISCLLCECVKACRKYIMVQCYPVFLRDVITACGSPQSPVHSHHLCSMATKGSWSNLNTVEDSMLV